MATDNGTPIAQLAALKHEQRLDRAIAQLNESATLARRSQRQPIGWRRDRVRNEPTEVE